MIPEFKVGDEVIHKDKVWPNVIRRILKVNKLNGTYDVKIINSNAPMNQGIIPFKYQDNYELTGNSLKLQKLRKINLC